VYSGKGRRLTAVERAFLEPVNATHRQYEALRAYFVDKVLSKEAAERFGYTPGSFRVLCHQFRSDPSRAFFLPERTRAVAAKQEATKTARLRERVVALRKQNLSVYDISAVLKESGESLSAPAVWAILHEEGFARLPRRRDEERAGRVGVTPAAVADVRAVDFAPREFRTEVGGLFLFVPMLAKMGFDEVMAKAKLPGSRMVPAGAAMRSLLALKLFGAARTSHVMPAVFDEGLALFAGLNVIPKRSFLTEYSCRIPSSVYPRLMTGWFDAMSSLGLERGVSFHLDFHSIPFHGEDALIEKHYVSKRSRRQKGVLAFLAQDAERRVFCYANAEIRKADQDDEILRFVEFWKARTGGLPEELIFDSKLTTYANLDAINKMGINFITLRRRSAGLLEELEEASPSAWRRIELKSVSRAYRTPKIYDQRVELRGYTGPIRQIAITELGHEEPTLLLTNQLRRGAVGLVDSYARRMLIENSISDGVDFFHMDALSSAVAMKINCDLQLTLMGSSLYRLLGAEIGGGYVTAESRHIFRDFVHASARVTITDDAVEVRFGKRAHNPYLLDAGFADTDVAVPWWEGRRLRLAFG
jgi:transposase